ncbi:MAG: hypothetical protein K5696_07940 [Lachnospiraceae bacterium]|nr:hypothetical protein [Lachnospiraceae bacterium]
MKDKMAADNRWWHINSWKYRKMKNALSEVCRIGDTYDPRNRNSARKMREAMDKLHAAADAYAKKEVYGKQKSTDLGISRKNTALYLLEISEDSRTASPGIDESRVADRRIMSHDGTEKRPTTLKALIDEEIISSRVKYGGMSDATARRTTTHTRSHANRSHQRDQVVSAPVQPQQ